MKIAYRLVHNEGLIEPRVLPGVYPSYSDLIAAVRKFVRGEEYNEEEDAVFYLHIDMAPEAVETGTFSNGELYPERYGASTGNSI